VADIDRIAQEVVRRLRSPEPKRENPGTGIPVTISARHVHVSRSTLETLFGERYALTKARDLGQPGEFASKARVTVVGRSGRAIEGVRVLGPVRSYTQLEISGTDAFRLGIEAPVRRSGDLSGTESATLVGPAGSIFLREGVIRATRHIHMTPRDAEIQHVADGDLVRVRLPGDRALVLEKVLVRVDPNAALELHLDTDDANAAGIRPPLAVEILR